MVRMRVRVKWDGERWGVDLPQYVMVDESFLPVIPGITEVNGVIAGVDPATPELNGLTCLVDVPDRISNPQTGGIDRGKINGLYHGQAKWGNSQYNPDI